MKKKVTVIIIFIFLILLTSNLLAVANLVAKTNTSVNELKGAEEVTITLSFDEYKQINKGINAYQATLEYDKEIFEEVTQEKFQCLNDWERLQFNKDTGEFVAIKRTGSIVPEDVVRITLKTKQKVKATTTEIKIKNIITSDGERDINVTEAKATINIIEEQIENPEEPKIEKITSNKYTITQDTIERILPKTTVAEFKQNVKLENVTTIPQMVFTDVNGNVLQEDDLITTATKLKVGKTLQYTLVVIGDIDKNSEININDVAQMKLHLIGKEQLQGIELKAADIDDDKEITINDLAQMKLIIINLLKLE